MGRWISELRSMESDNEHLKEKLDRATDGFTESLRATMPVLSGALKASGTWSSEMVDGVYEATVEFGGALAPYAPYVIGLGVKGEYPWEPVLPDFEPVFEEIIASEFRA